MKIIIAIILAVLVLIGNFITQKETEMPEQNPEMDNTEWDISIGDTIDFGAYEQDNNLENGPEAIEWEVLDIRDGKALLLSRKVLDCRPYNDEFTEVTWEDCSLRSWLNTTFFDSAFSTSDADIIIETDVINDDNQAYDTAGGDNTKDKIFLLSLDEIKQYYGMGIDEWWNENSNYQLACGLTDYARTQFIENYAAYLEETTEEVEIFYEDIEAGYGKLSCWWWLRSPGISNDWAAYIHYDGNNSYDGGYVNVSNGGVRPALWITMEQNTTSVSMTFDSFDGGGPEYSIAIEDPEIVSCERTREYDDPDYEMMDGAGYNITYVFKGLKPGTTTMTISARSPIGDNYDAVYSVTVDEELNIFIVEDSVQYR